jgi:hypothetical protein
MHRFSWLAVLAAVSSLGVPALAGDEKDETKPQHGGTVSSSDGHKFEVVFERSGLKVYPLTKDGKPVDASGLSGTATFFHPNSPNPWFSRDLARGTPAVGVRPTTLDLTMGLASVPETGAKVAFKISGFSEPTESAAEFTAPVRFVAPVRLAAPAAAPMTLSFTAATKADERAIAAQRVCKVSGESLGSMGTPIKATRGASSTFLCCRGCMAKVQANPDRFLSARAEPAKGTSTQ